VDQRTHGIRVSVDAVRHVSQQLHADHGRHGPDLRPGPGRCRSHAQGAGDGEQRRGLEQPGEFGRDGGGDRGRAAATTADQHRAANHHGDCAAGPDADRGPRIVDGPADELHISVVAVRQLGQQLRSDLRGHQPDLRSRDRRCRAHAEGAGDGEQRSRLGPPGDLGRDRSGDSGANLRARPRPRSAGPPSRT